MKNEYLLFTIIPIILVAGLPGCINFPSTPSKTTTTVSGYSTSVGGLNLILTTSNSSIVKGVPFLVMGTVKNDGDQEASNIKVTLLRDSGDISCDDFGSAKSVIPDPLPVRGQTTPISWSITPNSAGTASVKGELSYHYKTALETDINVFGYSYVVSSGKAHNEYSSSPGIKRVKGSISPVVLSVMPIQKPLLIRGDNKPSIVFYINNPGTGVVSDAVLKITSNPSGKVSCTPTKLDDNALKAINFNAKYPITCTISYTENELKSGGQVVTIKFSLDYNYNNVMFSPLNLNVVSLSP